MKGYSVREVILQRVKCLRKKREWDKGRDRSQEREGKKGRRAAVNR